MENEDKEDADLEEGKVTHAKAGAGGVIWGEQALGHPFPSCCCA